MPVRPRRKHREKEERKKERKKEKEREREKEESGNLTERTAETRGGLVVLFAHGRDDGSARDELLARRAPRAHRRLFQFEADDGRRKTIRCFFSHRSKLKIPR